jgi:hypothetical protein
MQTPANLQAALPSSWPAVLARVQDSVRQAEMAAREREQAVASLFPLAAQADGQPPWPGHQQVQECLNGLEACAARAAQTAEQADVFIAAGQDVVSAWLAACQELAQKLVKEPTSPVR